MTACTDPQAAVDLAARARTFMDEVVIPTERELPGDTSVSASTIAELRRQAREYDVYAPQIDEHYGGLGYDFRDALPTFEEAGRSLLGPTAMRVDAPDEGNMHLLELVGDDLQKEQYLEPLVEGKIRSGFSMTEPQPGAGSDPKMIRTTAERDGDDWVINGHKWWTTQGVEADLLIVFARTDTDVHPYDGCSLFLVPTEASGVEIVRNIPHLGSSLTGTGHAEIKYTDVRVPEEHLLGQEGEGFKHVQERLGPARLTHCMRYAGLAERSLDVAKAYVSERDAFKSPLAEKQAIRFEIAEAETRLHATRTMVRNAADQISAGDQARIEVAMCKVFTANVVQDIVDTTLQLCGGNGVAKDLPLADFYEHVRPFRIIDGADEVHKRTIARAAFENVDSEELNQVVRFDG